MLNVSNYFNIYFSLSLSEELFSLEEIRKIIRSSEDLTKLQQIFDDLIEASRYPNFLWHLYTENNILDEEKDSLNENNFIQALFDRIDKNASFGFSKPLITKNLQFIDKSQRYLVIEGLFKNSSSLWPVVLLAKFLEKERDETDLNDQEIKLLVALAASKIKSFADGDKFLDVPDLHALLNHWKNWAKEDFKRYVSGAIKTQDIFKFLNCFIKISNSETSIFNHSKLNDLLDKTLLDELTQRLDSIREDQSLSKEQANILQIYFSPLI